MGFIKIDRGITGSAIWNDGTPFDAAHAWIDLLLYVSWADNELMIRRKIIKVKRGSAFVSDSFLSNRWNWSRNRVRRFLDTLEQAEMITTKRTAAGTYVSVVNYAKFQDQRTTKRTASETTDGTTDGTAHGTQLNNIKEDYIEDYKNFFSADAQKKTPPKRSDVEKYCSLKGYRIDIADFFAYYNLNNWTLSNGRKITNWMAAVDYWNSKNKKIEAKENPVVNVSYYQEYEPPALVGSPSPFKNGAAAEMLRRKKERNAKR